ncbi:MAG: hypothetical protein ACR2L1_05250 [Pyrinomonadaceae bacterium]
MAQRFWTNQVVRGARHRRHGGIPGDERSGNDRAKRKTEAENAWRVMLGAVLKLKKPTTLRTVYYPRMEEAFVQKICGVCFIQL